MDGRAGAGRGRGAYLFWAWFGGGRKKDGWIWLTEWMDGFDGGGETGDWG